MTLAYSTATLPTGHSACLNPHVTSGHKALYTLEINGSDASIRWDLHDLNRLEFFDHSDESTTGGWRSVHITDGECLTWTSGGFRPVYWLRTYL